MGLAQYFFLKYVNVSVLSRRSKVLVTMKRMKDMELLLSS